MIDRKRLVDQLQVHEGVRLRPYKDTVGKLTIGIGRNLTDKGLSASESVYLCNNDIDEALNEAAKYGFFDALDPIRQNACVELMFNLGADKFSGFRKFILAMTARDYNTAEQELLASAWTGQVGPYRSGRIRDMIAYGEWPK